MTARFVVAVVVLVVLTPAVGGGGTALATDKTGETLVVAADGGSDVAYTTIQAAVDAATAGDTIRIRPGTYRERVTVATDVTLVAPDGASLNGTTLNDDPTGITIREDTTVVIDGLTISGYTVGIDAGGTTGDWIIRNITVRNTGFYAVRATGSTGNWRIENGTFQNIEGAGVGAAQSTGDWVIKDTVVRNVTEDHGIDAMPSAGDWRLENVTVSDVDFVGVAASFSSGDWRVTNTTIRDSMVGIGALETSGNWRLSRSAILNVTPSERYTFMKPPLKEGVGLHAANTNGSWTVRATRFTGNERGAIVATGADPAGDARRNWWGDGAGTADACTGAVNCHDPLGKWPPTSRTTIESPTADPTDPTTSTATKAPTPSTTTASDATDTTVRQATTSTNNEDRTGLIGVRHTSLFIPIIGAVGIVVVAIASLYRRWG